MSIRRGNSVIASSGSNGLQMFDMKWSDHTIDDLNWISSHSNSYHSGNTYKKMYNHLVEDYHNGIDETEVIGSYTISYKLAPDGHKIVDAVSSGVVDNIYEATGIAWYYVLDTTNQQFKLPRTKYGFVGLRDTVGNYVPESVPNIQGSITGTYGGYIDATNSVVSSGCLKATKKADNTTISGGSGQSRFDISVDASTSSSSYQDNAPVQQRATQMYLYFYTNQFSVNSSSGGDSVSLKNKMTNCLTEIPQDIKLELSSGTLTLKAGSKVYVPNGSGVFDEITIANDKTVETSGQTGSVFVFTRQDGSTVYGNQLVSSTASGTTPGTGLYYKTDTNEINTYNSGVFQDGRFSLPIAICTINSGTVTSIDQIFNGFGYIGSTVFALPGVKGLIPNGRNEDGTLKNTSIALTSVRTRTYTTETASDVWFNLQSSLIGGLSGGFYDEQKNYLIKKSTGVRQPGFVFAAADLESGKITNWKGKTVFHALDYNDSGIVSGWSMPSGKYIELSLGTTGSYYTAPANGYVVIDGQATDAWSEITLDNRGSAGTSNMTTACYPRNNGQYLATFVPVKKDDHVYYYYNNITLQYFRFVYAEGEI